MEVWVEYAQEVEKWDSYVDEEPSSERYIERHRARLRHPSWQDIREQLLWLCGNKCERCELQLQPKDLQVHHLHYDTLWYESYQDLQLLCPSCHYKADQERADEQARAHPQMTLEERIQHYMEIANRSSGQPDWPVSYGQARDRLLGWD